MAFSVEYGWDLAVDGPFSVKVEDDGTTFTVTMSTGTYCHTSISSISATSGYADFATALQTELNAGSTANTYTITWSFSARQYTIGHNATSIDLHFSTQGAAGTAMRHALGFHQDRVNQIASPTSTMRPYYLLVGAMGDYSQATFDYEPKNVIEEWETTGGAHGAVAPTSAVNYFDFVVAFETQATTFKAYADDGTSQNDVPWSFQHAVEHSRGDYPFVVINAANEKLVCFNRAEGASFRPKQVTDDYDDMWNWVFKCYLEGRL